MRFNVIKVGLFLVALCAIPLAALSQAVAARVRYSVSCPACTIVLEKVAVLDTVDPRAQVGAIPGVERDSKGRLFTSSFDRSNVLMFAPNGQFLQAIGRKGGGPGEFGTGSGIDRIRIGPGDTLHVFFSGSRVALFTPSLQFVRNVTLPVAPRASEAVVASGFLVAATARTGRQAGEPFHLLSRSGEWTTSFGASGGTAHRPAQPSALHLNHDGKTFWTAVDFQLWQWTSSGALLGNIHIVDVPWYPNVEQMDSIRADPVRRPSRPLMSIAGVDAAGLLWLNGAVLDPRKPPQAADAYRQHIEVFDPVSRTILVRADVADALRFIPRSNLAYTARERADGELVYTIWSVGIRRK